MPDPNNHLRAAREATPSPGCPGAAMSRAELADAVNTWLAEHSTRPGALDEHYVARLERGRVRWPGREYRAAFRAVLGASTDTDLGFQPSNRRPVRPNRAFSGLDGVIDPDEEDRLAYAVREPRRVDAAALRSVADVLAAVRRLEDETGAANVLPTVRAQRELVEAFAAEGRGPVRPIAVGLASELAQYHGWLHIPLGRFEEAQAHLDRAAVLGLEADDPDRLSTALSFSAYRAIRAGDFRTADALSDAARRDTRTNVALRTYETYQRAEVLARNGERTDAVRLLSEADTMVDHLPPEDELPPAGYWYTPAFFLGQKGFVLHALGDIHGARQAARDCLATMPPEWSTSEWATRRRRLAEE
ncbi:MAG TPA: XRE family transcriptional regulator [Actinophytocola sp.]|uniref:XRE family transcriptional regulator n=1 Tax=Actinophytocola sp. TaxID=1872138 RepID=UPI002DBA92D3|nr:XRE family transcriptional regulator [Actinophytocola sp.]HEU5475298.1 XRE family transcriptional regulator [Actinophytocola sp.]